MDRSWIHKSRVSPEYMDGVKRFIQYAIDHDATDHGRLKCPCTQCNNLHYRNFDEVCDHMINIGFSKTYTHWVFHGEPASSSGLTEMDGAGTSTMKVSGVGSSQPRKRSQGPSHPRKRSRGPTMCYRVYQRKESEAQLQVVLNEYDQPIGDEASNFTSFLGTIARDSILAPINYSDWRHLSKEMKDKMWERVLTYFEVDLNGRKWVIKSIGKKWREWKCNLKTKFFDSFPTEQECVDAAQRETRVNITQFMTVMDYWKSEIGRIRSTRNKKIREKYKMPHTTGTKSFARLRHEMQLQRETRAPPTRAELFIRTHTHKDGRLVDAARQQINEMNARMTELPEGSQDSTGRDDVYSQVMGGERHGRIRGLGLGPTSKSVWGSSTGGGSSIVDRELLRRIEDLQSENTELKNKLGNVMANQQKTDAMVAQLMRRFGDDFQGSDQ